MFVILTPLCVIFDVSGVRPYHFLALLGGTQSGPLALCDVVLESLREKPWLTIFLFSQR